MQGFLYQNAKTYQLLTNANSNQVLFLNSFQWKPLTSLRSLFYMKGLNGESFRWGELRADYFTYKLAIPTGLVG